MFFKTITIVLVFSTLTGCMSNKSPNPSSLDLYKNALALSYIERLISCPSSVHTGMYLDGGTIGVKAKYDTSEMLYFGLEYLREIEVNDWRDNRPLNSDYYAMTKHSLLDTFFTFLIAKDEEELRIDDNDYENNQLDYLCKSTSTLGIASPGAHTYYT